MPHVIELIATCLFAVAIAHTFSVPMFARMAHRGGRHAGLWHLLSEVEVVFGFWALVFVLSMAAFSSWPTAVAYVDSRNFTEPLFVFAIMVVASSRPILTLVAWLANVLAGLLPVRRERALFFVILGVVPLAGSVVTEPAAMTLAALMLRDTFFRHSQAQFFKYLVLGVLLVNVSIGGVLTSYAAPPVLMVASAFGWDSLHMLREFGWRAVVATLINAAILTAVAGPALAACRQSAGAAPVPRAHMPPVVVLVHVCFLVGIVLNAHHPALFMGLLLFFIGYTRAYAEHQSPLMIREGLMVGFFLAGLVVLGGLQKWWLQDLLGGLTPHTLFWGATALTAITDNAALTYLGALVEGTDAQWRYMLVAGAVTGGGLTVIANAPNPAAFAILKNYFPDQAISPWKLLVCALGPTFVAAGMFLLPV